MKAFRVNHVPANAPEGLALLVYARSLNSAVKKLRRWDHMRLPNGVYYVFESGYYNNGKMLVIAEESGDHPHLPGLLPG